MEKFNQKIDRRKKITQTGKPYKKYSGKNDQFLGEIFQEKDLVSARRSWMFPSKPKIKIINI